MSVEILEKKFGFKQDGYEYMFVITQCVVLMSVTVIRFFAMRSAMDHYNLNPEPAPHELELPPLAQQAQNQVLPQNDHNVVGSASDDEWRMLVD